MKIRRIAAALALGLVAGAFVAGPAQGQDDKPKKRPGIAQSFEKSVKDATSDTKKSADNAAKDVDEGVEKTREHMRGDGEAPGNAVASLNSEVAELRKIADALGKKGDAENAKAVGDVADRIEARIKRIQERFGRRADGAREEAKSEAKTIEKTVEKKADESGKVVEEKKVEVRIEAKPEN